ncbi:MAG TPA: rhodanese-like domain-containing protein [Nitrososphaeraceae archaeon]|nr:rhodanese-like domain-containing protein [Nitrososphaeraceae archaeon]
MTYLNPALILIVMAGINLKIRMYSPLTTNINKAIKGDSSTLKQIDPSGLKKKIDNNEDIFILDVRTPQEYELWRLSYDRHRTPKLIPVDNLLAQGSRLIKELPRDKEIITICAHGIRSMAAANFLNQLGYNVKSLSGGMAGWNKVYDVAQVPVPSQASFRIWQIRRVSKGCMGYMISSIQDKKAVVIDPSREIYNSFLKVAEDNGLIIVKVIDTHQHADHVSGVAKLVKNIKLNINPEIVAYFSSFEEYSGNENMGLYNIKYVGNGDLIEVGKNVKLRVIHTPGHTKGSMSFFIEPSTSNRDRDEPEGNINPYYYYLFTGDTLFIDGIGRPDLRDEAAEFAGILYETYHQKIDKFPPNTLILPAHFNAASIALKHGIPIYETIESLKKKIMLLSMNKEEFVSLITETVPPKPTNYKTIISINKKMLPYDEVQIPDLEAGPNSCSIS